MLKLTKFKIIQFKKTKRKKKKLNKFKMLWIIKFQVKV